MKKSGVWALIIVLILAMAGQAFAETYTPINVKISVYTNESMVLSLTGDDEKELTVENKGEFVLELKLPGTYHYELKQIPGNDSTKIYDKRVYQITVFVEDHEGSLQAAFSADLVGAAAKPNELRFDTQVKATPTPTPTPSPTPTPTPTPTPASSSGTNPKTGDESRLFLWVGISIGSAILIAVIVILLFLEKKRPSSKQ